MLSVELMEFNPSFHERHKGEKILNNIQPGNLGNCILLLLIKLENIYEGTEGAVWY